MRTASILGLLTLWSAACLAPSDVTDVEASASALVHSAHFRATHYDMHFDLNTRDMEVTVRLRVEDRGRCLTIPMRTTPLTITLDGASIPLSAARSENGQLTVCDPSGRGFRTGSSVDLSVESQQPDTTEMFDVGYSTLPSPDSDFSYLLSWVEGCDLFGPCDTRPDNFATYHFVIQHDLDAQVLCPGVITHPEPGVTDCRFDYEGGPSYSAYGMIARSKPWEQQALGTWSGVDAQLYSYSPTFAAALDVKQMAGALAWLVDKLGAFPYGRELRIVEAPTYWSGFEHPGMIVLSEGLGGEGAEEVMMQVLVHELAHQWAGNQTTLASRLDFVWKESMAEYLTFLYQRSALPAEKAAQLPMSWKLSSSFAPYFPVPLDSPQPELAAFYGSSYGPGPMVLFRQLAVMFDEAAVLNAIRALVGSGEAHAIGVSDVQQALEEAIGVSLDDYFQAWVYGSGAPSYPIANASFQRTPEGAWRVQLSAAAEDGIARGCAFRVRLLGDSGQQADYRFNNGPSGGAFPEPPAQFLSFTPTSLILDPENECLIFTPESLGEARSAPVYRLW
jgi:aminopeptidase N